MDELDVRTGAVVRTLLIGMVPAAAAVDARTGRAVVAVNAGGAVRAFYLWARLGDLWQAASQPLPR